MVANLPCNLNLPDAEEFLHLMTEGWADLPEEPVIELRCLFPDRTPFIGRYSPDKMGFDMLIDDAAVSTKAGMGCYPVINPVRSSAPTRRNGKTTGATDADIIAARFCWADGDDEAATYAIKNFAGPKYTFAVTTGRTPIVRPHIYWRLDEWVTDLAEWSQVQQGIAAQLSTDKTVVNPSRIMRLPGTINWPTPQKAAKGRVPELVTLRTDYDDEREPVAYERMRRVFLGSAPVNAGPGLAIDTGPQPLDRERARIQALSGQEWHNAMIRLVASYVSKGLSDDEIHGLTQPLTLAGYTPEQTRQEVQTAIDGARRKGWTPQEEYTPNFDHAPAPTASDPTPQAGAWRLQRADEFTADFVAPEYLIEGVMQRGRLYTLTAPTGAGKTAAMLYASTAIATGNQFCGLDVEQGDVLFLAGENPDDVRARVIATMKFYGIRPDECHLHFIAGTFSIRQDMDRLREEAGKLPNLVLIVVDTFAAYFDGEDENSNAQALDFARVIRKLTSLASKPVVVMPAHPIKNASRNNLSPKGGSSLVNEVDGNLTLWNDDGLLSMHWQVKHRGPDFEPLKMELEKYTCAELMDRKGREMPTILAKPVLSLRAAQIARDTLAIEDQLLLSIHDDGALTARERCDALRISTGRYSRIIDGLAKTKLIRKFRRRWELTKDGERAVNEITGGTKQPAEADI